MKQKLEITALIIFELMGVWCSYLIGSYVVQLMKRTDTIVLVRDVIGAYVTTFILVFVIILWSWLLICDKMEETK